MGIFSLEAGRGLGTLFQTLAAAAHERERAEQDGLLQAANLHQRRTDALRNEADAERLRADAARLEQVTRGLGLTIDARTANLGEGLTPEEHNALRFWQWTGEGNPQQIANAAAVLQKKNIRNQAVTAAATGDTDAMNRYNTLTEAGAIYMPFAPIGNTGVALNRASGQGLVAHEGLQVLYGNESRAQELRDRAAANASNAQAGNAQAKAQYTRERTRLLGQHQGADQAAAPGAAQTPAGAPAAGTLEARLASLHASLNAEQRRVFLQTLRQVESDIAGGRVLAEELESELTQRLARRAIVLPPAVPAASAAPAAGVRPVAAAGAAPTPAPARVAPPASPHMPMALHGLMGATPAPVAAPVAVGAGLPPTINTAGLLDQARSALAEGADRAMVEQRLRELGVDPRGI